MSALSLADMVKTFGRIGLLSFGGPAGQIALMQHELVEKRRWISEAVFLRALSLSMLLPGPEAMQLATYCGWRLGGLRGGLIAGALFILPGALLIGLLFWFYIHWGTLPLVQSAFLGIKAVVVIVVVQAVLRLSRKALPGFEAVLIAGIAFLALFLFALPFPLVVLVAALWGIARGATGEPVGDRTPISGPAMPMRQALLWLALWLGPLAAISLTFPGFLSELAWFFARLAIVSFGGAYALLAYMTQALAGEGGWISTAQLIDALGLAETTPGPLILVTQFVAMLSGYLHHGPAMALAAGLVALWALFVPCFFLVFVCAPHLERLTAQPRLSRALSSITAAVVGVIASLSLWFALHLLFIEVGALRVGAITLPWPAGPNLPAFALVALTAGLQLRAGLGLAWTLPGMAVAGALLDLAMP